MQQKVLVIDDSKPVQSLIRARLREEPVEIHSAYCGETGLAMATTLQPDLILLDVDLPQMDGFEVCRRLKAGAVTIDIPVIFLIGAASAEQKLEGLEIGAVDYISKPFEPAELKARVRVSLRTKYLLDLLNRKAMIDGMTGLWNHRYLDQRLVAELAVAKRYGRPCSCILIDVDQLTSINQRFGHSLGDEVLRALSQLFLEQCRAEDVVCRYNVGFAILTPGVETSGAACLAERLRTAVAKRPIVRSGKVVTSTCSFGVAGTSAATDVPLLQTAEQALSQAKGAGGDKVVLAGAESARMLIAAN